MFVPNHYSVSSAARLREIVMRYPMATLITNGESAPLATRLPIVFALDTSSTEGSVIGSTMLGHMNRANPHWEALAEGNFDVLAFSGPESYISPMLYRTTPALPTWNFVSVHFRGRVEPIASPEETLSVVRQTALVLEERFGQGWDFGPSSDYARALVIILLYN